jgi:Putative adhesin
MRRLSSALSLALGVAIVLLLSGCQVGPSEQGAFDRDLTVTGSVRLELANGSGGVHIARGPDGRVHVHGEVRASGMFNGEARKRLDDILARPPIEQSGNTVRIGKEKFRLRYISIGYTIEVPQDTQVEASLGSGSLSVQDIRGPVRLTTGSGSVRVAHIREEVGVTAGSGSIDGEDLGGDFRATAGSGSVTLSKVQGDVQVNAASGSVTVTNPGGRVTAHSASGGIKVQGAASDLSAKSASGSLSVQGNPAANSLWELRSVSGGVDLTVPSNANFLLNASTVSGGVETGIPIVVEEQGKHALRARVGNGGARVEAGSVSGSIHLRGAN